MPREGGRRTHSFRSAAIVESAQVCASIAASTRRANEMQRRDSVLDRDLWRVRLRMRRHRVAAEGGIGEDRRGPCLTCTDWAADGRTQCIHDDSAELFGLA